MNLFSQRKGIIKAKEHIQKESMDRDLKISLWNVLKIYVWEDFPSLLHTNSAAASYARKLWMDFFKKSLDTLDDIWALSYMRVKDEYEKFEWFRIYDLLEFTVANYSVLNVDSFVKECNRALERELSAYRFVGVTITEISSEEEIQEIENAMADAPTNVQQHLNSALKLMSDKTKPDYRNSSKESISAVEAICRKISGDNKATLGTALNKIEKGGKVQLHPALKEAFSKLYGYASDADGIRHSLLGEESIHFEDAKFMLVASSAFINYLIVKADKAGVKL